MKLQAMRLVAVLAGVVVLLGGIRGFADSQVRIVRLSAVEGNVEIDRQVGQGFEKAILNLPVVQGASLRTGSDGRAEVEFEQGTVIRLVPNSELDFPKLGLRSSGHPVSTVFLRQGTAYFNVKQEHGNEFTVAFPGHELAVPKSAHFRLDVTPESATLAVLGGELPVKSEAREVKLKKDEELTFSDTGSGTLVAEALTPAPYDQWDQQRADYHQRYYSDPSYGSYPYYGSGDLNFYGSWYNVPGGVLWQPFGVGYGWSPFANGWWTWYPGAGYAWVSSYPWGWLPYRYGSWMFVPGWGWGWMPGSTWNSWVAVPAVIHPPAGYIVPAPPVVAVNPHPTVPVRRLPQYAFAGQEPSAIAPKSQPSSSAVMPRAVPPVVGGRPSMRSFGGPHVYGPAAGRTSATPHSSAASHSSGMSGGHH